MSDTHDWREANDLVKWPHCGVCGIIKRRDGGNKPCKGATKVVLRDAMTDPNKAAVLAKWPDAECYELKRRFCINAGGEDLGFGTTEPEAWADAARRLNSTFQDRWQAESRRRA